MRPGRGQPERRERMDRDKLKDLLFEQFEKHQVILNFGCSNSHQYYLVLFSEGSSRYNKTTCSIFERSFERNRSL